MKIRNLDKNYRQSEIHHNYTTTQIEEIIQNQEEKEIMGEIERQRQTNALKESYYNYYQELENIPSVERIWKTKKWVILADRTRQEYLKQYLKNKN